MSQASTPLQARGLSGTLLPSLVDDTQGTFSVGIGVSVVDKRSGEYAKETKAVKFEEPPVISKVNRHPLDFKEWTEQSYNSPRGS